MAIGAMEAIKDSDLVSEDMVGFDDINIAT